MCPRLFLGLAEMIALLASYHFLGLEIRAGNLQGFFWDKTPAHLGFLGFFGMGVGSFFRDFGDS